ncbi:hypothetical protein N9D82_02450 [Gammaproteobacteria bacterium]|nr:hypothetical protein [Gammaproteobacteria bacterium]
MKENNKTKNCDACGGTISKFAEICPHCGNPVNLGHQFEKILWSVGFILLLFSILGVFS